MTSYSLVQGEDKDSSKTITAFTDDSPDLGWYIQNDSVMGGRSVGRHRINDGKLFFSGTTNTNGGGFSSIRSQPVSLDMSDHTGIRLRVKGDGRRYSWQLTTNVAVRGRPVGYWADFETKADEWVQVDILLSEFKPRFRGTWLSGPKLDPSLVSSMSLYIYDGKDGAFELFLDSVSVY